MCECCSNHAKKHEGHVHVGGVNCGHCVSTIEEALADIPGFNGLEHFPEEKQVKLNYDTRLVDVKRLEAIIIDLGYKVG